MINAYFFLRLELSALFVKLLDLNFGYSARPKHPPEMVVEDT